MLAIRLQRTGRKGHAMFRMVVQDSRQTPTSGKVVAHLGHYDPHNKTLVVDKDKTTKYLSNGAQPSNRAAILIKNEGIKLPEWVKLDAPNTRNTKNVEKLRKNRPAEEKVEDTAETSEVVEEPATEAPVAEEATGTTEAPAEAEEKPAEATTEEK
jgi:small subunit ribosomal protein S16